MTSLDAVVIDDDATAETTAGIEVIAVNDAPVVKATWLTLKLMKMVQLPLTSRA
ncbi:cadherin-like domain-containing protein [Vibrio chagasii]|nr:cadherin-like domain-containing protein [Vibrio chagasii]